MYLVIANNNVLQECAWEEHASMCTQAVSLSAQDMYKVLLVLGIYVSVASSYQISSDHCLCQIIDRQIDMLAIRT